jgi:hypothetical protein
MRKVAASFATILLFAITLLFLGPPLGSLDVDGDGVPDIPVMVIHGKNNHNVRRPQSDRVGFATASAFLGLMCNDTVLMKARIVVEPRGSRLDSVVPLRC